MEGDLGYGLGEIRWSEVSDGCFEKQVTALKIDLCVQSRICSRIPYRGVDVGSWFLTKSLGEG